MSQGFALAQSSNGVYTLMGETTTSGGGQIGGGNPMKAQTALGLPAAGMASNNTFTLIGGIGGSAAGSAQPITTSITVSGTTDDPSASITVNGLPAVVSGSTFTASGVMLSLGPNTITVIATDGLGNRTTRSLMAYLDLPPVRKEPRFNITVTGTISDPLATITVNRVPATVASGQFAASIPLVSGYNFITATAVNPIGNQVSKSLGVFVPPPALPPPMPTVGTVGPALPRVTTQPSIMLSGTKTAGTSIWLNGAQVVAADNNTTWTVTVSLVEGDNDLAFIAKDSTGTASAAATVNIIRDNLPPVVTFAPPTKTNFNPAPLTGSVDDSNTVVTINGITAARTKRAFDVSVPLTLGSNALCLIATSPNGYVATKDYTVNLGTIPTIQTSQPADASKLYAGTAATLQVTAQDQQSDPIQYQFVVDGVPLADWSAASSQTWTPSTNQSGVHTVTVKVRDDYGGSNSKDVEVFVVRPPVNHP